MCSAPSRKLYPSDVSDDEWLLVVPSPTWMTEAAPQRDHSMRELFNALRSMIRHGITWHAMPNDFLPWAAVCQQPCRWLAAGCFEAQAQDLRTLPHVACGRPEQPLATIIDSRTLRSTPKNGTHAGYDGASAYAASRCTWGHAGPPARPARHASRRG